MQNIISQESLIEASKLSFRRLTFYYQARNPVMFVVFVCSILTSLLFIYNIFEHGSEPSWFIGAVSFWLWFTVIFANFAEAVAEGKGKAQAASLRKVRRDIMARKISSV